MIFRINRNILDFKYSITFIGDNTFSFYIIVFKHMLSCSSANNNNDINCFLFLLTSRIFIQLVTPSIAI